MKYKVFPSLLILTGSLVLLSFSIKPFAYTLRAIDPATGNVRSTLEQSTAGLQKGKGKTSTSSQYNITGSKSSTRLKISEAVFQSTSDKNTLTMNPADYIILYKLTIDKNNRSFTINNDGSSGSLLPITFTSLDYGSHRISPSSGLVPGEYVFIDKSTTTTDGNFTVWTFGVD